jgi:hypothetical protein
MMTRTLSAALLLIGVGSTPLQATGPGGVIELFHNLWRGDKANGF